jgi:hypothetical protein
VQTPTPKNISSTRFRTAPGCVKGASTWASLGPCVKHDAQVLRGKTNVLLPALGDTNCWNLNLAPRGVFSNSLHLRFEPVNDDKIKRELKAKHLRHLRTALASWRIRRPPPRLTRPPHNTIQHSTLADVSNATAKD